MRLIVSGCLTIAIATLSINTVKAEEFPIITRLIVREGTVVVSRDTNGKLRYSLVDRDGDRIETNIPEAQLAKKYPDIYDRFNPAVADTESPYAGMLEFNR